MLIGIDTRPCSLSLRDRSMFIYEMTSKSIAHKNVFMQKSIFVDIFFSFNPNRVMGINGGYFPAICRECFHLCSRLLKTFSKAIVPIITDVYNKIVDSKKFPDYWKKAVINHCT